MEIKKWRGFLYEFQLVVNKVYIYRRVMNLSEIQRKIVIEARLIYN